VSTDAGERNGERIAYEPQIPERPLPGIGIVGCGSIVREAHLPAYERYGLDVVGVYDIDPSATAVVADRFDVGKIFTSLDELLADESIAVVDVATRPEERVEIVERALDAGKHVLAQKPAATSTGELRGIIDRARRRDLKLAVNQNGRWAPPWRVATLLIQQGAVGDVLAITHLHDMSLHWTIGRHFNEMEHFLIYDYSIHWIDITRCWLAEKDVASVRALEYRTPNQPPEARTPWSMWVVIECRDGTTATIRSVGCSETGRHSHPFAVHGSAGTIRGSVLGSSDYVELDRGDSTRRFMLRGDWYPDGFAGSIGELLSAIAENREPFNSAEHNLLSLQLTLAAVRSSERRGEPVTLDEV
jgi:predicted dehydrogenase